MKPILKFLSLIVLVIVVSLIPELIGGDLTDILKKELGDNYLLIIIGIGILSITLYTFWFEGDRFFKTGKKSNEEKIRENNLQKIREGLLESYQNRLNNKLAARYPINLEVKYSTKGTTIKAPLYDNNKIRSSKIKEELIDVFDKHKGRLLIVGEPGAGKTTLLLQLACQLIERGEKQIPVIIDIATWRFWFWSVEEWFEKLLPQMGFSKSLARLFIEEGCLLPLFDGLDELNEDKRSKCLGVIGKYGIDQKMRYVISSRIVEYIETHDAPVKCQIMVKPLTLNQIKTSLKEIDLPETNGILDAIKKDSLFAEAIETPFYLNTVQLLFASMKSWEELGFKSIYLNGRKFEIVERFIHESTLAFKTFSSIQVKKYLGFLARGMRNNETVSFELISLQSDSFTLYLNLTQVVLIILIKGMAYGLFIALGMGVFKDALNSLFVGIIFGLVFSFQEIIKSRLPQYFNMSSFKTLLRYSRLELKKLVDSLSGTSIRKILLTSVVLIIFVSIISGIMFILHQFMKLSLIEYLFLGIILLVISTIDSNTKPFLIITRPYDRFQTSEFVLHISILQHFHLRWILYRKDLLPLRLVKFLKEATKNNILESPDGGSWRFRHRVLQDYFADYWKKNYAGKEGYP